MAFHCLRAEWFCYFGCFHEFNWVLVLVLVVFLRGISCVRVPNCVVSPVGSVYVIGDENEEGCVYVAGGVYICGRRSGLFIDCHKRYQWRMKLKCQFEGRFHNGIAPRKDRLSFVKEIIFRNL